jgi:F-box and leucine-rich repeat protein 1 (S-phase kinase-associated protein 2)
MANIAASGSNLETLHLAHCSGITDHGLEVLLTKTTSLVELNVGWINLTEKSIVKLVNLLTPTIQRLNLSGCRGTLLTSHVTQLVTRCKNIKELDLSDASLLDGDVVEVICAKLNETLESISLSRVYGIKPCSYTQFANLPQMQSLNVFGVMRPELEEILKGQMPSLAFNETCFSTIARPTVGIKRTSLWGIRIRDNN